MTSNLLKTTLLLLDATALDDWKRLAKELDVTVGWLRQLANGEIKEPGVNKIERLYSALSGKTVKL
jgi:transcriptional regulator with XRE-family HTH domain